MAAYSIPQILRAPHVVTRFPNQAAITPADNTKIDPPIEAIYVGVSGDVKACPVNSATALLYKNALQGTYLIGPFQGVDAAGTTATNLIGCG